MRMRFLAMTVVVAGLGLTEPAPAQTADPAFSRLIPLVAGDPAAALAEVEGQLAGLDPADLRAVHDLNRLAADLLTRLDRHAEAARRLEQLARFATRQRDRLGLDPVPLWQAAAAAHDRAGDLTAALRMLEAALQDQRDAALPGPLRAATLVAMAALADRAGDPAGAEAMRKAAAAEAATRFADRPLTAGGVRGDEDGFALVDLFYATDRARSGSAYPSEFYGHARGPLDYGRLQVSIPETHVPGAIEKPSVWRLEFSVNPARHIALRQVEPLEKSAFFNALSQTVTSRPRKEAFVFIHGYNVSFEAAAKRAAQLAHDMNHAGVPVLYSWPSRGSTVGYMADSAVVQLSARRLSGFLEDLVARSGATTIHIVAHSMGNRALTEALELMSLRRGQAGRAGDPPPFDQIVFAAPDVDAGLFAEMLPGLRQMARRLTLYASENDWALVTSRKLHGDAPRAGQGGSDTLANPGIDSIDMSDLGEDMLAHGYFADDSSALADLMALFWRNLPPEQRCGLQQVEGRGPVATWRYVPGACPDNDLMAVIATLQDQDIRSAPEARRLMAGLVPDPAAQGRLLPLVMRMLAGN